jgi:hypothetical protein
MIPNFIHLTIRMTSFDPQYLCIIAPRNAPPQIAEISIQPSLSIHSNRSTKHAHINADCGPSAFHHSSSQQIDVSMAVGISFTPRFRAIATWKPADVARKKRSNGTCSGEILRLPVYRRAAGMSTNVAWMNELRIIHHRFLCPKACPIWPLRQPKKRNVARLAPVHSIWTCVAPTIPTESMIAYANVWKSAYVVTSRIPVQNAIAISCAGKNVGDTVCRKCLVMRSNES